MMQDASDLVADFERSQPLLNEELRDEGTRGPAPKSSLLQTLEDGHEPLKQRRIVIKMPSTGAEKKTAIVVELPT